MDWVIILYFVLAMATGVIGYLFIRFIDFHFTKVEDKRRYGYAKGFPAVLSQKCGEGSQKHWISRELRRTPSELRTLP